MLNIFMKTLQKNADFSNPATDFIHVTAAPNDKYSIISMTGKLVKSGTLSDENTQISITDLSPGSYVLKCGKANKSFVKR